MNTLASTIRRPRRRSTRTAVPLVSWSATNATASALGTMPAEFHDGPKVLSEASEPEVNASYRSQPYRYSSSDPVPSYMSGVTACPAPYSTSDS